MARRMREGRGPPMRRGRLRVEREHLARQLLKREESEEEKQIKPGKTLEAET